MAHAPTIAEEEAKRLNRKREYLVGERTRIVNRIKGYPGPTRRSQLQTDPAQGGGKSCNRAHPGGHAVPPNALAKLQRDLVRLGFVVSQIREIEEARQKRSEQQTESGPTPSFGSWPQSSVLASKRRICWSMRCCRGQCVTAEPVLGPAKGRTRGQPNGHDGRERRAASRTKARQSRHARLHRGMIQLA